MVCIVFYVFIYIKRPVILSSAYNLITVTLLLETPSFENGAVGRGVGVDGAVASVIVRFEFLFYLCALVLVLYSLYLCTGTYTLSSGVFWTALLSPITCVAIRRLGRILLFKQSTCRNENVQISHALVLTQLYICKKFPLHNSLQIILWERGVALQ